MCARGNIEAVKVLAPHLRPKDKYEQGFHQPSPFQFACQEGCQEVVRFLIDTMEDRAYLTHGGGARHLYKPLHYACMHGRRKVAEMLLDALDKGDWNLKALLYGALASVPSREGISTLEAVYGWEIHPGGYTLEEFYDGQKDVEQLLIERFPIDILIHEKGDDGLTPLARACQAGRVGSFEAFVRRFSDAELNEALAEKGNAGMTALQYVKERPEIRAILQKKGIVE